MSAEITDELPYDEQERRAREVHIAACRRKATTAIFRHPNSLDLEQAAQHQVFERRLQHFLSILASEVRDCQSRYDRGPFARITVGRDDVSTPEELAERVGSYITSNTRSVLDFVLANARFTLATTSAGVECYELDFRTPEIAYRYHPFNDLGPGKGMGLLPIEAVLRFTTQYHFEYRVTPNVPMIFCHEPIVNVDGKGFLLTLSYSNYSVELGTYQLSYDWTYESKATLWVSGKVPPHE